MRTGSGVICMSGGCDVTHAAMQDSSGRVRPRTDSCYQRQTLRSRDYQKERNRQCFNVFYRGSKSLFFIIASLHYVVMLWNVYLMRHIIFEQAHSTATGHHSQ